MSFKLVLLSILLPFTLSQTCNIQIFQADPQDYYDVTYGTISGLYNNPATSS